ncbi:hypothetical protein GC197_07245 [bacterium]|nr:hypothetical protein [bacterium]
MFRLRIAGIVIGVALCFYAFSEFRIYSSGTSTPQVLTMAEFDAESGIPNSHITLTEFDYGVDYIYEQDEKTRKFERAWILLTLPEGQNTKRPVIAAFKVDGTEDKLNSMLMASEITGVLTSGITGGSKIRNQVESLIPGSKDDVLTLQVDRGFPSIAVVLLSFAGGLGLLAGSVVWQGVAMMA